MGRAAAGLAAAVPVAVLRAAAPKVVECPVVVRVAAVRERESQAAWVAGTRVVAARAAVVKAAAWVAEAMAPCVAVAAAVAVTVAAAVDAAVATEHHNRSF